MLTKKELEEMGKQFGVSDITDTEYEKHSRFSVKTALTRILNERKGTAGALKRERSLLKGYLLGGRDFVYKGITLEQAKSQFVTLLSPDENGKSSFVEGTVWGHLKPDDVRHGQGVETEIEISKSTNDRGQEFENRVLRKVVIKDSSRLTLKRLTTDSGVTPRKPDDIGEDDLYETVIVRGKIANVEQVPKFDEGQIVDEFPLIVNDKPSVRLGLETSEDVKVYLQFDPARMSEPYVCFPDFIEILKENNIESAINSLVSREVVGIGTVRRYQVGEPSFCTINATALFSAEEPEAKPYDFPREKKEDEPRGKDKKAPEAPKAPSPPPAPKAPPAPPTTQKEPAPAPAGDTQVRSKVETYKAHVKEALELLGVDSGPTIADIRELKPELKDVKDPLLEALLKKVKDEMVSKK